MHNATIDGPRLLLRIGINAGEPLEEDGDLHGSAVNLAARVCAVAPIGETLVTSAVRDLAAGKGFTFEDCGSAHLKGFTESRHIYRLTSPSAASD